MIVGLPGGAWLAHVDLSLARALVFIAGAACLTFAWIRLASPQPAAPVPADAPAPTAVRACTEHRHGPDRHRISHAPKGRCARDLRCPASYAHAHARRSTRR